MADALKAELAAADAVEAGKGPWLTLSASYGHKAGTLSSSRDGTSARWEDERVWGRGAGDGDRGQARGSVVVCLVAFLSTAQVAAYRCSFVAL